MRKPFQEKTVSNSAKMETNKKMNIENNMENYKDKKSNLTKKAKDQTDIDRVVNFLQDILVTTEDTNLKYDLSKCLEIIQGKENIEMTDLRDTLKLVLEENERLSKINIELLTETEYLNEKYNK